MSVNWFRKDIHPGDSGPDVAAIQRKLGVQVTGVYDDDTQSYVRGVQLAGKKKATGIVDSDTAKDIGDVAEVNPDWYTGPINAIHQAGEDVRYVRGRLGLSTDDDRWEVEAEQACKRWQGTNGLPVTGFVDERMARQLG